MAFDLRWGNRHLQFKCRENVNILQNVAVRLIVSYQHFKEAFLKILQHRLWFLL